MNLEHVVIVFQIIAFLFAISVHESAHAWMANMRGDPTARMLGRITLNPIKHIDPVGTVLLPLIAAFTHIPMLGWAKPTPVTTSNFANPVLDDILTAVAGPVSNFVVATGATLVLLGLKLSPSGRDVIEALLGQHSIHTSSVIVPLCVLFYTFLEINVLLAVFNLIPIPPLDGSHVLRHFLPEPILRVYDMAGMIALFALVFWGSRYLNLLLAPVMGIFDWVLMKI
jgi:Zn-dependent protease